MNIRNNITNYLFDKEYVICTYEDYIYIFNYNYLDSFNSKRITIRIPKKQVVINGEDLKIVKITKEEILINGIIRGLLIDDE